ncbi:MAG: SPOR domain-containing protein [Sideroxydans sp.]|nr:SPOR domain-containing protein [Sideroxydans sp.]
MAKKISTEEESNLQRQARRRLIGAVALVLAIVVFLPMVFDSAPPPAISNDIELRIPDKNAVEPLIKSPVLEQDVSSAVVAVSAPVLSTVIASEPASAVALAVPKTLLAKPESTDSKTKVEPKPKAEATPAAKTKTEPKAEVKSPAKSGWVVQVGAYSKVDAAKQLQAKLSKEGFHVYSEKVGLMVRVRVGSYPTRDAAEKIKLKLVKMGLNPNVVELE